jgi:hypothetical protein
VIRSRGAAPGANGRARVNGEDAVGVSSTPELLLIIFHRKKHTSSEVRAVQCVGARQCQRPQWG